jgi:hypothetical protein
VSDIVYPMRFMVIEAKSGSYIFYKSEVAYNSMGANIPLEYARQRYAKKKLESVEPENQE